MTPEHQAFAEQAWPWTRNFRKIIQTVAKPRLTGDHIISACDISGSHKGSRYTVHGFIFADASASPAWPSIMSEVRRRFLPDGRRMSYKALNDGHRRKALIPFLAATEAMNGVCCLVAIAKDYRQMAASPNTVRQFQQLGLAAAKWNTGAMESALRTVLMWSVILGEVCICNQNVTWVLDEDEIVANEFRHDDLLKLSGQIGPFFIDRPMRELCVCTTASEGTKSAFEDFVAIADLPAGAFSEAINSVQPQTSDITADAEFHLNTASEKCLAVNDWFFSDSHHFRRIAIVIDKHRDGHCSVRRFSMR